MSGYMWIPYLLILGWLIFSIYYVYKAKEDYKSLNIYIFDSIPTVFTTLGVLGTFIGIAAALWNFDVDNITGSIPTLLAGLKVAFLTSIIGIVFALIFSKFVSIYTAAYENTSTKEETELSALNKILELQDSQNKNLKNGFDKLTKALVGDDDSSLATNLIKLRVSFKDEISNLNSSVNNQNENIIKVHRALGSDDETSLLTQFTRLRADNTEFRKQIDVHTKEIITALFDSNKIMKEKFDEFAELLSQNNTKILVEAIENVIGEFNVKLAELINRLVKENFEELNRSVQRLNEWQQNNKEQVEKLIQQYKEVSEELKITSKTLIEISESTKSLSGENSLLKRLVEELQQVMIEDKKFTEIVDKVKDSITSLKENTEILQGSSKNLFGATETLSDYIKREESFTDSVNLLINRLKEIEEIKELNGKFWNDIEQQMKKGVSILGEGNQHLLREIEQIDNNFNQRLNKSFINLDKILQAMVLSYQQRTNDVINRINGNAF